MASPVETSLAGLLVLTAVLANGITRIRAVRWLYVCQSALVALYLAFAAVDVGPQALLALAAGTVLMKGFVLDRWMRGLEGVRRRDDRPTCGTVAAILVAGGLAIVARRAALAMNPAVTAEALAAALTLILTGSLLIATRERFPTQVLGLLTVENGLAVAMTHVTGSAPEALALLLAFDAVAALAIALAASRRTPKTRLSQEETTR